MEITVHGRATRTETESGVQRTTEEEIRISESYEDPRQFQLDLYTSPSKTAETLLPDEPNCTILPHQQHTWTQSLNANAVEISQFAEELANSDFSNEQNKIDILTGWLQRLPSMRIRRALHSCLQERGVEVETVD